MRLRAADDDAVAPPFDDVHVEVGVGLRRRRERSVALDVGLRHGHREIVGAAMLARMRRRAGRTRCRASRRSEADTRSRPHSASRADLLDQHDQRSALGGRQLDERAALQQILRRAGNLVVARVVAVAVVHDAQRAMAWVLGEAIVDGRVVDGDRDHGMGGHVRHPLSAEIDRPPVPQALDVLFGCSQRHLSARLPGEFFACFRACAPRNRSRKADFRNLPVDVRGISSTNSKPSGSHHFAKSGAEVPRSSSALT